MTDANTTADLKVIRNESTTVELGTTGISKQEPDQKILDISGGPIVSTTIKLSIPIFISQLVAFASMMVDTYFVSLIDRSSTAILSGVGLVATMFLLFYYISTGLYIGISSVTARGIGQQNQTIIKRLGDIGLLLATILCASTWVIGLISGENLINLLAGSKLTTEAIKHGSDYLCYLLPGMGLVLIAMTLSGILQGEGRAKEVGLGVMASWIINIVLNPILIFGLKMGVKGSALATSISILIQLLYYLSLFIKKETIIQIQWRIFKTNAKIIKEIIYIGVPAATGMVLVNMAFIVLNNLVGSISEVSMNAWVLAVRLDQLITIPGAAIGLTTIPMIGQNYGQGNLARCREIFRVNVGLSLIIGLFLGALYMIFAPQIFSHLSSVPDVIVNSVRQVRLLTLTTVATTGLLVTGLAFQATGRPMPNLACDIIRVLILSVPLALSLSHFAITHMNPIFLCVGVGNLVSFAVSLIWASNYFNKLQVTGKLAQA